MKSINGKTFQAQLVVDFDFTLAEADKFLAAKTEDRAHTLSEILANKNPLPYLGNYNAEQFQKAIGQALANLRERELKQLPPCSESSPCPAFSPSLMA